MQEILTVCSSDDRQRWPKIGWRWSLRQTLLHQGAEWALRIEGAPASSQPGLKVVPITEQAARRFLLQHGRGDLAERYFPNVDELATEG